MKGYKKKIKKWCMVCIMVLVTFSILWVGMNLSMIFGRFEISVDNVIDVIDEKYKNGRNDNSRYIFGVIWLYFCHR